MTLEQQQALAMAAARLRMQSGAPEAPAATTPDAPGMTPRRAFDVAVNAGNEAIAAVPDTLLNAPNNLMNLGRAVVGTAAGAAWRTDLMPELTPNPDFARRGVKALGFIRDENAPKTRAERLLASVSGGAIGTAMTPAKSIPQMLGAMGVGALGGTAANETREATGRDDLAIMAGMITPNVVQGVGDMGRGRLAAGQLAQSRNAVEDATLAAGRDAGYVTPPTAVVNEGGRGFINRRLESIGGKAAVKQEAGGRNQGVTNEVAVRDLNLPQGTAINEGVLETFRNQASAPYREIAAIDPVAAQTLQELRQARNDAQGEYRHYERSADPTAQRRGQQFEQRATMLENALEAMAVQSGRPQLVDQMREARTAIAKSYDVERALNLGNADVSAPKLGAAYARGRPLSGGLETTARFSNAFPQFTTEGAKIPTPGVSKSEALAMTLLGGGGAAAFGPMGAAAGALPLASGPARSLVLSQPYQRLMASRRYAPLSARGASALPSASAEDNYLRALMLGVQQGASQ